MSKIYVELIEGSNTVNMVQVLEGGRKKEKLIGVEDFITSLTAAVDKGNYNTVKSPLFREIKGIKLIQSKQFGPNSHIYILQKKKHNAIMKIYSKSYGEVGIPNLLFGVKVINNRLSQLFVVCTKDTDITDTTEIYMYPFTNVSGDKGVVCLGGNRFKVGINDKNNEKLYEVPNQFFSMPNTIHSYTPKRNTIGYEFEEMLKDLSYKEFDESLLVENKLKTYSEWFNNL